MKKIELLSPAGNMECLKNAVKAGADAIYLGGILFSARAFAGNFNDTEIIEAIKYCHLYGVKVYVTCNILVYEREVDKFINYIRMLHQNNVDGIIIQDLGMVSLIREKFPNLELHASTQMHIHNLDGVKVCEKLGLKRVVIARETPVDVIKNIVDNTNLEIEVFGHGSLCVSYSGQCLFSSLIGNRSANRGSCTACCRLPYNILNKDNQKLNEGNYPLSMKDLNSLDNLDKLIESGASSLKIEGRMKSKEYVYVVTKIYREAIDSYYEQGKVIINHNLLDKLKRIFYREYTKGYLFNEDMKNIINSKYPNHQGINIGKVIDYQNNYAFVKLNGDISIFDGLRIINDNFEYGHILNEFYLNKKLVKEAHKNDIISFKTNKKIPMNSQVLLTKDNSLIEEIEKIPDRKIPIKIDINILKDKPITLKVSDSINEFILESIIPEISKNIPITKEVIKDKLSKLGNSIYYLKDIDINLDNNLFINMTILNNLKRELIDKLNELRIGKSNFIEKEYSLNIKDYPKVNKKSILVRNKTNDLNYDLIYSENKDDDAIIKLPKVMDNYDNLDINKEYLTGELGSFNKLKNIYCDYSFNVTNSYTVAILHSMGAKLITLSLELNYNMIKDIIDNYHMRYKKHPNLEVIIKGRREVMTLKTNLNKIYENNITLEDRFKNKYPIREVNNLTYIYDYKLLDDNTNYYEIGVNYLRENREI